MSDSPPAETGRAIYVRLLLTVFFWGATWIAAKVAVAEAPPLSVASWRFCLATLPLGIALVRREGWPRWTAADFAAFAALGLTGIFAYNLCFLYALKQVEAGRGALVTAMIPALVALADWLFFHVPMTRRKALGVALALGGCLFVVGRGDPLRLISGELGSGELMLFGTALSWVSYTLISRHYGRRYSPLAMTTGACLAGWVMLTACALVEGSLFAAFAAGWRGWSGISFLGLFGTALAFTWYSAAINTLGSTRASAFINLVPVFAVLLGAVLLGERLGAGTLAGGAAVIAGVLLTTRASARS